MFMVDSLQDGLKKKVGSTLKVLWLLENKPMKVKSWSFGYKNTFGGIQMSVSVLSQLAEPLSDSAEDVRRFRLSSDKD